MARETLAVALLLGFILPVPAASQPDPIQKKETSVKQLLKERVATLWQLADQTTKDYLTGRVSFDRVQRAMRALLHAELEMAESDQERIAILEKIVALAKEYEKHAVHRYQIGAVPQSDALLAKAGRLEAEIALERAKSKLPAQRR